jgi:hypothetical protein
MNLGGYEGIPVPMWRHEASPGQKAERPILFITMCLPRRSTSSLQAHNRCVRSDNVRAEPIRWQTDVKGWTHPQGLLERNQSGDESPVRVAVRLLK